MEKINKASKEWFLAPSKLHEIERQARLKEWLKKKPIHELYAIKGEQYGSKMSLIDSIISTDTFSKSYRGQKSILEKEMSSDTKIMIITFN